jgi:hypothetical protein
MFSLNRLTKAALLAGAVVLAGCEDALSPDTVDPQQLSGDLQQVASAFDNNAAFQAMATLSPHFPHYGFTGPLLASMPQRGALASRGLSARIADPRLLAGLRSPGGIHALFPSDALGKTFVWDEATDAYVASAVTGAPANGIRIILYVADPNTGMPFEPLQPIGNLDLTDESTAQADRLGVLLRLGGTTIADYDVTLTVATTSASLRAAGFVRSTDGTYQADFDFLTTVGLSSAQIVYQVTGSDGTVVHLDVSGGAAGAHIVFRVSRERNTVEIEATDDGDTVSGVIRFNGTPVGTITGPSDDPVITGSNGRELTAEQIAAIAEIFSAVADFLGRFADGIYGPALVVFGSGV